MLQKKGDSARRKGAAASPEPAEPDQRTKMLEENRYCGDILMQVAAAESALQAFGYLVLQNHLETCVVEEIQKGNTQIVEEALELIRKLK